MPERTCAGRGFDWKALALVVALVASAGLAGCKQQSMVPMPGVVPSAGMLLKCEKLPLSAYLCVEKNEIYRSAVSNDFYPHNISSAKFLDRMVQRLMRWTGHGWEFVDYIDLEKLALLRSPNVSNCGRKILFARPEVTVSEGDYPRQYPRDRRTYRVEIYNAQLNRRFVLDSYCTVYGLSWESYWRPDNKAVAFSTTCAKQDGQPGQLVVLDDCGNPLLSVAQQPQLLGLEFICWSGDGQRLAALRPAQTGGNGAHGGTLVELTPKDGSLRDVGEVSPTVACHNLDRFDRLVKWDESGRCVSALDRTASQPAMP